MLEEDAGSWTSYAWYVLPWCGCCRQAAAYPDSDANYCWCWEGCVSHSVCSFCGVVAAGELQGVNTGANKERLESTLRAQLTPAELEGKAYLYPSATQAVTA
jgi:hypothetical protein